MAATIVCRNPADAREVVATYAAHAPADVAAMCARADVARYVIEHVPDPASWMRKARSSGLCYDRARTGTIVARGANTAYVVEIAGNSLAFCFPRHRQHALLFVGFSRARLPDLFPYLLTISFTQCDRWH